MTAEMDFSDERLTAFLDGELPEDEARLLEARLAEDPGLQARLDVLHLPLGTVRTETAELLKAAPVMPDLPAGAPANRGVWAAASVVAALVIGGVFWGVNRAENPDWVTAIASYQALYVPATLSGAAQEDAVTASVLQAYSSGPDLSLERVKELDGLTFKRAQMLGFHGTPLLQLAYVTETGAPVALCLVAVDEVDQVAHAMQSHGLNGVQWVDGGTGFLLIGEMPSDALLAVQAQFSAG